MARTKQTYRTRSKAHIKRTLKCRKRKNRLRASRRAARSRPHRSLRTKK